MPLDMSTTLKRAAGIMLMAKDGTVLMLKRSAGGDHPGEWCFPGGGIEDGESEEDCARRETLEETGFSTDKPLAPLTRRQDLEVDFTTFLVRTGEDQFTPTLCDESTGFMWIDPLEPLTETAHPGCAVALARLSMTELDVARAISVGELTSPQRFENMTLFALRITGTGTAWRTADKQWVYRKPEHYLTDEFLARSNGLPVVYEHPKKKTLDSKEFGDRVIGTILLPYIKADEVWGIARIYDDEAIELMAKGKLSTSPGVVLRGPDPSTSMVLDDGKTLLIEGKPNLIDHLAVCDLGVWDKGGDPAGVLTAEVINDGASHMADMTEEEKKAAADKAKADAETPPAWADSLMKKVDAACAKVDAMEARADAAKADAEKADKAKADAEEDEKEKKEKDEKEKADAAAKAVADSAVSPLVAQIADLNARMPAILTDADQAELANAQAQADSIFQAFGKTAPRPGPAEKPLAYRKRLLGDLKSHSPRAKDIDIAAIADSATFTAIEGMVFADAMEAARQPGALPDGVLIPVVRTDAANRRITTFIGTKSPWTPFRVPSRRMRLKSASQINQGN